MCNVLSLLHASSHLCCFQSTNSAIIEVVVCFHFDIDFDDGPEEWYWSLSGCPFFVMLYVPVDKPAEELGSRSLCCTRTCRQHDARTICLRTMCPQPKSLGRSVPCTIRPLDDAALGHVVPDQYVLILNCINVLVKISYFVLCFAMLWRVWTTGACAAASRCVCTCTSAPAALVSTTWACAAHECF